MFNPNKPVYQIGMEDGGGTSWPHSFGKREVPKPEKLIQLRLHEEGGLWVTGDNGVVNLIFDDGVPEPMVALNEVAVIKVRDFVIECRKRPQGLYTILSIKSSDGAVFNTLQLGHSEPLVKMLRVLVVTPIADLYK